MELTRLKKLLMTATRGHKLLKDKLDELMKQFLDIVKENKKLREEAESALNDAYKSFIIARAVMNEENMGEALMMTVSSVEVAVSEKNIMSVRVPRFTFNTNDNVSSDAPPYGYAFTSASYRSQPLEDFSLTSEGFNVLCAHSDIDSPISEYAHITASQIDSAGEHVIVG